MSSDSVGADGILITVVLPTATFVVLCTQREKGRETPLFKLESPMLKRLVGTPQIGMTVTTIRAAGVTVYNQVSLPDVVEISMTLKADVILPTLQGK